MIVYNPESKSFYSTLINGDKFVSGFCTKTVGDARFPEVIFSFLNENGIAYQKVVIPEQIHSVNIVNFTSGTTKNLEKIEETDGVITKDANTVLTIITADCLPAIFLDKKTKTVGISHQGWRGGLKKMVTQMVGRMVETGCKKEDIRIALGPAIGACCYDIDEERYYDFMDELDGYSEKIFAFHHGKRYLNLLLLNYLLLVDCGIPKVNIDYFPFCTQCDKDRFFSRRRDAKQEHGEMLSYIMIQDSSTGLKGSISLIYQ